MSKSDFQIRDYKNIRSILRDIYIFGCFSRDDFISKGISGRKYDIEQRRINAYLPDSFLRSRRIGKKVQYYCSYGLNANERRFSSENRLVETYRNKSFTMLDITSYFWVLTILNYKPGCSLQEILKEIPQVNEEILYTKDNLRVKLIELEERKLIEARKSAGKVKFYLAEDIWKDFSIEELKEMYLFLDFLQNTMPLEMPYVLLMRKLRLYLCSIGAEVFPEGVLQFKHNHLFNVLDNDIMRDILLGISERKSIGIIREGTEEELDVIPIRIIHDSTYGRQYLLYISPSEMNTGIIVRLDKIAAVSPGTKISEEIFRKALQAVEEEKQCWCTAGLGEELRHVVLQVRTNEKNENYLLRRLLREGHGGKVEKIGSGIYQYEIDVRDPMEMLPWIRSFGDHMKVIDGGGAGLEQKIAYEWEKTIEKYNALGSGGLDENI